MPHNSKTQTSSLFATDVLKVALTPFFRRQNRHLKHEISVLRNDDDAGQQWSQKNYPRGYTSYASANQLHKTSPTFAELESHIDVHVARFVKLLGLNLSTKKLKMSTCWVNVMETGCTHGLHIHPHSILSGTYYVDLPKGSRGIRFEDPRYSLFMNRPPLKESVSRERTTHVDVVAKPGEMILFESWLRHDVPANESMSPRISVSFNYELTV